PHQVPLEGTPAAGGGPGAGYIAGGGCETCDPVNTVIPPSLRHEYWVELSVGQARIVPLPFSCSHRSSAPGSAPSPGDSPTGPAAPGAVLAAARTPFHHPYLLSRSAASRPPTTTASRRSVCSRPR